MLILLALAGCSSPEAEAGAVALKYASLAPDDAQGRHLLACADERSAKTVEELKVDFEAAKGGLFGGLVEQIVAASGKAKRSISNTTLDTEKRAGSITIATSLPKEDGAAFESTDTVQVRLEDPGWCVVTGWAEQKRLDGIVEEANDLISKLAPWINDWKLDEADTALQAARAKLDELPDAEVRKAALTRQVDAVSNLLDTMKKGWVGGRWSVNETTDPMTDEKNIVVTLRSVDGMPNSIGDEKPVSLVVRCLRNELEVYVATQSMLDSDWRSDSVSGQHRFGSDPAVRFSAGASKDRQAAFLRKPAGWIQTFLEREEDGWTIELPLYGRKPSSVRFDLTGASKALPAIPPTCK